MLLFYWWQEVEDNAEMDSGCVVWVCGRMSAGNPSIKVKTVISTLLRTFCPQGLWESWEEKFRIQMDFFPPESHERRDKVDRIHGKFTGIVLQFYTNVNYCVSLCLSNSQIHKKKSKIKHYLTKDAKPQIKWNIPEWRNYETYLLFVYLYFNKVPI